MHMLPRLQSDYGFRRSGWKPLVSGKDERGHPALAMEGVDSVTILGAFVGEDGLSSPPIAWV